MKALCNREGMLAAFGMVSGIAPARSPKPILQNLKLVADPDSGSTLMATDLEVGVRYLVLGVKADRGGSVILPTGRMGSILRTTTDEELAIESDSDHLLVRGVHSQFKLPSEDPELFPEVPEFAASAYHVVAARDLRRAIKRTSFATDVESTRYALGGVLFDFSNESLTLVGTDGRRLARMIIPAEVEGGDVSPGGAPVIPVKALKLLERNLSDDDPPVHIAIQAGAAALIRTQRAVIYSRLVEGRFPRYQDVFPAQPEARIPMEVGQLLSAVEQASVVTSEESRGVDFHFGGGTLKLTSQAPDAGAADIEMPIAFDGKPVQITFDPKYLADALKTLDDTATVTAEIIDSKNAAVFRTEDQYTYVVMPLTRER